MNTYKTSVYIDGFNFYHSIEGWIKNNEIALYPSLMALCEKKLASFPTQKHKFAKINIEKIDLHKIHYFTAMVAITDDDLQKPSRQKEYNRALEKEGVEVTLGEFKQKRDNTGKQKRTEKQSDVNLATRFVYDASTKKCNYAVIISSDTDFCGAIKFVLEKCRPMIVDMWTVGSTSRELRDVATICHPINSIDFNGIRQIANHSFDPSGVDML